MSIEATDVEERRVKPLREPARARMSVALYRTFVTREAPAIARGAYTGSRLEVPALVILGGQSPLFKMSRDLESSGMMRVEVLPDAGHFVPEEKPEEVRELVEAFLAETAAAG